MTIEQSQPGLLSQDPAGQTRGPAPLRFPLVVVLAACAVWMSWSWACAQTEVQPDSANERSTGWRMAPILGAGLEYDDNVFLLAPRRKGDLDPVSSADISSRRYADMESAGDWIASADVGAEFRTRGLFDRRFTLTPEVRWEAHLRNTRRSHGRLALALEQALRRGGRLRVRDRYTPSYFSKNYLADAVDEDGSLTISPEERRYRAGEFAENQAWLDYRARLAKAGTSGSPEVFLQLAVGHMSRAYDAPFASRDLQGPLAAAELDLELSPRVAMTAEYELAILGADPSREVLILDEPDFGRDLNGNGSADELDVRAVETVDRSRIEHEASLSLEVEASPRSDLTLSYALRVRSYGSDEPFDVAYRDRHDTRHLFEVRLRQRMRRHLDLVLGAQFGSQSTNRGGDPGAAGEVDDYRRGVVNAALAYHR